MNNFKIYGYFFDCVPFDYEGKTIDGFCYTIKVSANTPESKLHKNVFIQTTRETGFTIVIKGSAKDLLIQPYQTYILVSCNNHEQELVKVDEPFLKKHKKYILPGINKIAEACWSDDNG